ncbi:hypothetical protein AOLI_G00166280 [Acnodon oligacanthus]
MKSSNGFLTATPPFRLIVLSYPLTDGRKHLRVLSGLNYITVWYDPCTVSCCKTLQSIVRAAEKIAGTSLPYLQEIYNSRLTGKALCMADDHTDPLHHFFSLLPSGRRLRSLRARTSRLGNNFIHRTVRMLNSLLLLYYY